MLSGKLLKTIQAMYTNVRYTIKVNELFTDYFKVDQGVKQGCPLSPTLFNIFINGYWRLTQIRQRDHPL